MAIATADIHVKVDPMVKECSESVLEQIGISMSDLINMTLRRVIYERNIPFDTKVDEKMPACMSIKTEDELLRFLDKAVETNETSEESYSAAEIRKNLGIAETA